MKTRSALQKNQLWTRPLERGMAVLVLIVLLSIILLYVAANVRTLYHLGRELKLIEQRQIQRLSPVNLRTNSVAVTDTPWTASAPSADR
jgi:hypothetical protein